MAIELELGIQRLKNNLQRKRRLQTSMQLPARHDEANRSAKKQANRKIEAGGRKTNQVKQPL